MFYESSKNIIPHCCISGRNWNNASNAGPTYLNLNNAVGNSNSNIGAHQLGKNARVGSAPCPLAKIRLASRVCHTRQNPSRQIMTTQTIHEHASSLLAFPPIEEYLSYKFKFDIGNISSYGNAVIAHGRATRGKKSYRQVIVFDENRINNLKSLCAEFADSSYRTGEYELKTIMDTRKEREIAKTTDFRDRVAQWMIGNYLIPQLTCGFFSEHSHAAIPGKGIHTAKNETVRYVNQYPECLKVDVRKFFPSINREVLKGICDLIFDDCYQLRDIIRRIIDDAPKTGIPIGNLLSQYFANIYLTPLDRWLESIGAHFTRYMDDIVVFGNTKSELRKILHDMEWFLESRLYLHLKPNWQIFSVASRGVDFVGYRIRRGMIILRKSTFAKLRRTVANIRKQANLRGYMTQSEVSSICSYLGWMIHCTKSVRDDLYKRYFKELISTMDISVARGSTLGKYYSVS